MAFTKYSDIVTLRESKPAYNIQNEESGEWNLFIANEQFNGILGQVVNSVFNNNVNYHKPFWMSGTYGTGKSHAGSVIKHLLCDPIEDIQEYINYEYKDNKHSILRDNLLNLRSTKRLFPVTLFGLQSITHKEDLSLELQRSIISSLKDRGIEITVKTDFDNYIEHIENNPDFWSVLIKNNPQLPQSSQKLIQDLQSGDKATLGQILEALRNGGLVIRLKSTNLPQWIFEVQNKLAKRGVYDGLLIIWDEFTDVMASPIGQSLLVSIQEIAENMMNSANDSYFLLISHPSALDKLKAEEREKTIGRYHYMIYNMEPVSAFKIMSRKFKVTDEQEGRETYTNIVNDFYASRSHLLDVYARTSSNKEETRQDIQNLFPLHPSTANLATYYAREAGSSSRSVFEFLGVNPEIKDFLEREDFWQSKATITADYLWDYVLDVFTANPRFGAVTERYNSYKINIQNQGADYFAVFKGILLLNALNNIANHETVTPSEENIKRLFEGTPIEDNIDSILDYFNQNSIIQRAPGGLFSIQFSALPAKEIEDIKLQLINTQFKHTSQVVNFDDTTAKEIGRLISNVARENKFRLYSEDANDSTLLSKIEQGYKSVKPYELFFAFLFARHTNELQSIKTIVENASKDDRFFNVVFVVFENVFSDNKYDRFIEYQANATCAQNHGFVDQQKTHVKCAVEMIREWMFEVRRGNFTYYLREMQDIGAVQQLASTINAHISPTIFSKGVESLDIIRNKFSKTYWKKASVKATVSAVLSFHTKDEISQQCGGAAQHVAYLLQDSVDDNLAWYPDLDKNHPLLIVSEYVDKKFKAADKSVSFNLGDKLIELSRPPYGLYQSYAGMGMLAFALRKHVKLIFDTNGKPREAQHIIDDVVEVFRAWESGGSSNKLNFMFETKEARDLCNNLVDLFDLTSVKDYSEISSLTDARWALRAYLKMEGFPLWSLKYSKDDTPEGAQILIDNIIKVCEETNTRNPHLLNETLDGISTYRFEIGNLLNDKDAFLQGFVNYLKSINLVNLQGAEADSAIEYIKKHLQQEVGLWSEAEVKNVLQEWRIETTPRPNPGIGANPTPNSSDVVLDIKSTVSTEDRQSIKDKVREISDIAVAKQMLEEICDSGSSYILDIIQRYVQRI